MSAFARALRGPIWLIWLGLLLAAGTASAETVVRLQIDVDGDGRHAHASFRSSSSGSFTRLPAGAPACPFSPVDRRVDDQDVDDLPDGAGTPHDSSALITPAAPIVVRTETPTRVTDAPDTAPVWFDCSTTLGPRPPPLSH